MLSIFYWFTGLVQIASIGLAQALPYLHVKQTALQSIRQLETRAIKTHDSLLLAESWYQYGKEYEQVGDNERAEPYFLNVLRWCESRRDSAKLLNVYYRLSELEQRQNHLPEALNYVQNGLHIAEATHSVPGLIEAYRHLGHVRSFIWNVKTNQMGYNNVYACYTKSGQLAAKIHDTLGMAEANVYLGSLVMVINPGAAVGYLNKALPLFVHLQHDAWQIKTLIHLSDAYRRTGKLSIAWQYLQQAEHICQDHQINEHGIRAMLEDRTVQYYRATGQWKKALNHFERLNQLEKQQLLADRDGAITRLNVAYETEKKESLLKTKQKAIDLNAQNLRLQRMFTLIASLLFMIAAGMSVLFFRSNRKNQRTSRHNAELVKEQNHRVKNNLQVVSSLLSLQAERLTDENAKRAVEESQLRIQTMAILHRRLYDGEQLAKVAMNDFVRDLINGVLQTFDYTHVFVSFDINPIYLSADKAIPVGLILNELTTNACKYAFPTTKCPEYGISCYQKDRTIQIRVTDNGPGLDESSVLVIETENLLAGQHKSFGIALIQAQVAQLNGAGHFESTNRTSAKGAAFNMEFNV